jgi:hypothetical protein
VFPAVMALSAGYGNRMLLAFPKNTSAGSIRARLNRYEGDEGIKRLAKRAEAQVADFEVPAGTTVFTDDFAPVEEMTRRMLNRN